LKMTHFEKPDHKYHRVMFEFTDKEIKDAGYWKLRFKPTELEILQVLQRMADKDKKQLDVPWIFSTKAPLGTPYNDESMPLIITDKGNMKISNIELQDLQRKKDGWKAKALRLIGFLNNKDEVIKRLLRENKHYRNTMTEGGL